ncbi:hypothetical protein AAG068_02820 [Bacillus paramycoides]
MGKRRTLLLEAELKLAKKSPYVTIDEEALNFFSMKAHAIQLE